MAIIINNQGTTSPIMKFKNIISPLTIVCPKIILILYPVIDIDMSLIYTILTIDVNIVKINMKE